MSEPQLFDITVIKVTREVTTYRVWAKNKEHAQAFANGNGSFGVQENAPSVASTTKVDIQVELNGN